MGELSVFETWAPPHCCGSWLRPKLLPPIGSSLRRMRVWVPAVVPVLFLEPMGGESGDGGYGGPGLPGVWGCGGAQKFGGLGG